MLVLSEFAGSAHELDGALLVNPHDLDGLTAELEHAVYMPEEENKQRMRRMRAAVKGHDVFQWADSFLETLAA